MKHTRDFDSLYRRLLKGPIQGSKALAEAINLSLSTVRTSPTIAALNNMVDGGVLRKEHRVFGRSTHCIYSLPASVDLETFKSVAADSFSKAAKVYLARYTKRLVEKAVQRTSHLAAGGSGEVDTPIQEERLRQVSGVVPVGAVFDIDKFVDEQYGDTQQVDRFKAIDKAFLRSRACLEEICNALQSVLPEDGVKKVYESLIVPLDEAISLSLREARYGDPVHV